MSPTIRHQARRAALGVLVGLALLSNLELLRFTLTFSHTTYYDGVGEYERRLLPLKAALPARGRVGYTAETMPRIEMGQSFDPLRIDANTRFQLTQYALAPVVLIPGYEHRTLVGNFHVFEPDLAEALDRGFALIHDFGGGVMVFAKPEEPGG